MQSQNFINALGLKKLYKISFGLIASIFLLWTLFNASSFVPQALSYKYNLIFLGYGLLGAYTLAREDMRSLLSRISFIRAIPFFILSALISTILFSLLIGLTDTLPNTILSILLGVPLSLQLINAFVFSTIETSFFQGILDRKIGIIGSIITAGIFHMYIWPGSLFYNFLGATFLFFIFSLSYFLSRKYFNDVVGLVIVIGIHTGYNLAKYKIIFGL